MLREYRNEQEEGLIQTLDAEIKVLSREIDENQAVCKALKDKLSKLNEQRDVAQALTKLHILGEKGVEMRTGYELVGIHDDLSPWSFVMCKAFLPPIKRFIVGSWSTVVELDTSGREGDYPNPYLDLDPSEGFLGWGSTFEDALVRGLDNV